MYKSIPILNNSHWNKYLNGSNIIFNNTELKFQGTPTLPSYNEETPYKRIYSNINVTPGITYTLDNFKIKHRGNNNTSGIKIYVFYREFDTNSNKIEESEKEEEITLDEIKKGFTFKDSGNNAVTYQLGLKIEDSGVYLGENENWDANVHTRTFILEDAHNFFTYTYIIN